MWSFRLVRPVQLGRKPEAVMSLHLADISLPDLLCNTSLRSSTSLRYAGNEPPLFCIAEDRLL